MDQSVCGEAFFQSDDNSTINCRAAGRRLALRCFTTEKIATCGDVQAPPVTDDGLDSLKQIT